MLRAVLFDFGGVVTTSPFDAFARYENEIGIPVGTIRTLNATNPDSNAWAKLERSEVDVAGFVQLFEEEAAAAGYAVDGHRVVGALYGSVRPEMVEAIRRIKAAGWKLACLTNNFSSATDARPDVAEVMEMFDVVVESSKVGVRKPEIRFYEMACELAEVTPDECVFLDDLGINLKPAKALGMQTIKVLSAEQALTELEAITGLSVR